MGAAPGLPADRLELEITETSQLDPGKAVQAMMRALKGLGVRLAVDDLGAGYSRLEYLRSFPLDNVKIDRSFITPIETDVSARRVLRAIIDLCRSFNMSITAEGVETAFQAEFLREANCDRLQGYYFARPGALPTDVDAYRRLAPGAAAGSRV